MLECHVLEREICNDAAILCILDIHTLIREHKFKDQMCFTEIFSLANTWHPKVISSMSHYPLIYRFIDSIYSIVIAYIDSSEAAEAEVVYPRHINKELGYGRNSS